MVSPAKGPPAIFNDMPPESRSISHSIICHGDANAASNSRVRSDVGVTYVDTMYVRNSSSHCKSKGTTTTYYYCRLMEKHVLQGAVSCERQGKRSSRTPIGCPCKIKTIEYASMLLIEKSSVETHNHEYSALEFKMPSAIRIIAALEVAKGYKPSEVSKTLRNAKNGNLAALGIAGGANFSAQAVHNAIQSSVDLGVRCLKNENEARKCKSFR